KHPRFDAPAVRDAIAMLLQEGCVKPVGDDVYQTTPRGSAWVLALCNVERPREVYMDAQGNVLN
ncbi:MAG: hypothetical protein Q8P59_12535, partial [Dehalococcoidia bacterium]|nr:hypothetical protein [Dehalococcoidia bacterium]